MAMSFDLPYASGEYSYKEVLPYNVQQVLMLTQDPNLHIHSHSNTIERLEDVEGFAAYQLTSLPAESLATPVSANSPEAGTRTLCSLNS